MPGPFDRIEIMECKLYVRMFQFVSANEVRQERSVAEPIKPIESLPTLLGKPAWQ